MLNPFLESQNAQFHIPWVFLSTGVQKFLFNYVETNPDSDTFCLSGKDSKEDSSDEDEDAETKKLRGQLNSK